MHEDYGHHADSENLVAAGKSPGDEVTGTPWHLFRLCHDLGRRLGSQRPRCNACLSRQARPPGARCNEDVPVGVSVASFAIMSISGYRQRRSLGSGYGGHDADLARRLGPGHPCLRGVDRDFEQIRYSFSMIQFCHG
jgi:hypothetical protein